MNEFMRQLLALPPQQSSFALELDRLHYFVIVATMFGALAVAAVAAYFIVRFRASASERSLGDAVPTFKTPRLLEAGLIGTLVLLFFGWWYIGVHQYVRMQDPPDDAMKVYVVGKQWMWKFTHENGRATETRLYVPAGRPVKLLLTSRDVIHSFFVPAFRVKQDAVPGRYTVAWFEALSPGVYPILCAEYCGTAHSSMRGEVVALAPEQYQRWLDGEALQVGVPGPRDGGPGRVERLEAPEDPLELVEFGAEVAAHQGCLRCHTTDGSPHIGPSFAGLYGAAVPLQRGGIAVADEAYLTQSMMDPLADIHAGYQPVMPSYRGALDAGQTAALVEYIRSLERLQRWNEPAEAPIPAFGPEGGYPDPRAEGLPRYPSPTVGPREEEAQP